MSIIALANTSKQLWLTAVYNNGGGNVLEYIVHFYIKFTQPIYLYVYVDYYM